jgi:ADP-heptose:LPS heptosyltransferase
MSPNHGVHEPRSALLISACSTRLLWTSLERVVRQFGLKSIYLFVTNEFQVEDFSNSPNVREVIFQRFSEIGLNTYRSLRKYNPDIIVLILDRNTRDFYSRLELLAFALPARLKWYIEEDDEGKFPRSVFYKRIAWKFLKLMIRSSFSLFVIFFVLLGFVCVSFFVSIRSGFSKKELRRLRRRLLVVWNRYKNSWWRLKGVGELGTFLPLELLFWMEFLRGVGSSRRSRSYPRRILFIRLDSLGDVINSTPGLRAVRATWPDAFITIAIGKWTKEIIKYCPYVNQILVYSTNNKWHLRGRKDNFVLLKQLRVFWNLRLRHYDLAIDPCGWPETYKLLYMSGAKVKVANDYGRWDLHYNVLLEKVRDNDGIGLPETKRTMNLLKLIGVTDDNLRTELWLSPEEEKIANDFLERNRISNKGIVGLHPGAPWPPRRWFVDRFAQLADMISEEYGFPLLIFAGPGEEGLVVDFMKLTRKANSVPVIGKSLREVMAIISRCALFVCNDSGPMHIAVAFKVPTVAIFGPGGAARWAPPSPPHIVIRNPGISCSPCSQISCQDNICLTSISVDQVWEGVRRLIEENGLVGNEVGAS